MALTGGWAQARVFSSPLSRARETAIILTGRTPTLDPRLSEMAWGRFEGRRLADLRAEAPGEMAANEARGLDFRPPGGRARARCAPVCSRCSASSPPIRDRWWRCVTRA